MNTTQNFQVFAAKLRHFMAQSLEVGPEPTGEEGLFNRLALDLFALQFDHNAPYRKFCSSRGICPPSVRNWTQIPAVPAAAFKELALSCLKEENRTAVFYSSGTTEQRRSRHFHNDGSLLIYEESLLAWFQNHLLPGCDGDSCWKFLILTPLDREAPHSSLVHMFKTVRAKWGVEDSAFTGRSTADGGWTVDLQSSERLLREASEKREPLVILGTAFSCVQLLDGLDACFALPRDSRIMETGGYKGRSRELPKEELHAALTSRLGVPSSHIVAEYGMSELSSQAYDRAAGDPSGERRFRFPPWARAQVISPETGEEAEDGETGLLRTFDLANVYSVMAVQTEDLAVRHGSGFDLAGRAELAEARGCSLMTIQ